MTHPIPSGTRDVLPDARGERRATPERVRAVFDDAGSAEICTPALEYDSEIERADLAGARPAYRLFDEHGNVLVLRSDMTVPIAGVVATRYPGAEPPLRFSYLAHAYRGVRPQRGQAREFLQAGIELIGSPAPDGTAEALSVLCPALDAAGLRDYRVGLGDASLFRPLLDAFAGVAGARERILHELVTRDFVGLERELDACGIGSEATALLLGVPQMRGGADVLEASEGPVADALAGMRAVRERVDPPPSRRVIFV